jgi:DNA-binding SARP family transcriptional activator
MERGAGRATLTRVGEGYLLDLGDDVRIDFIRFQDLIIAARRAESAGEKAERYAEALALYRGGFLPEDTFAEWTDHQRRLLNDAWFEAAEYLAREALREGHVEQAIDHARRILQQDATSESAWHVLLQGLIDRRRLGDLRKELERCRRAFDEAFGEEPPKRLERMVEEALVGKG